MRAAAEPRRARSRARVLVAMSGGVDSAVAAARLVDAGHDVVGVTLHLWDYPEDPRAAGGHGRCCAPEDQYDAARVAERLGIPHYTFDRRDLFARAVVAPFVDAYLAGETPSPCATCNREVKLAELFALADRLGADDVATGHYARVARDDDGTPQLLRGRDPDKDQSYFLYATPAATLARLVFPVGDSTKAEVRAEAIARDLPGARKGESQELCFVGDGSYAAFVEARADGRVRPGRVLGPDGAELGRHAGVHRFTVGQRKGLGVATGQPAFVTRIDARTGDVVVGDAAGLAAASARLEDLVLAPGERLPLRTTARIRYRHAGCAATVASSPDGPVIAFDTPARAVTPGQVAVFYDGDRVQGGARVAGAPEAA